FSRSEILLLLDKAKQPMKAMVLLGVNCGFGNADCGQLPLSAVHLNTAWINFPRPKTGVDRQCTLWPETVAALEEALACRPTPKEAGDAGLFFLTSKRASWFKAKNDVPISKEFAKLLKECDLVTGKGRNFYTLRHTFRTVADEAKDQPAADHIMGHEVPHMSSVYREGISDARLVAVADHVRKWLVGQ